jgi:hypothetical protein
VEEEKLFTKHAIKIVIEAKRKKKNVLGKKDDHDSFKTGNLASQKKVSVQSECKSRGVVGGNQSSMVIPTSNHPMMQNSAKDSAFGGPNTVRTSKLLKNNKTRGLATHTQSTSTLAPMDKRHLQSQTIQTAAGTGGAIADSGFFFTEVKSDAGVQKRQSVISTNEYPSQISTVSQTNQNFNSKISMVLDKSKFWESRLKMSSYQKDVRSLLIQSRPEVNGSSIIETIPKVSEAL